MTIFRFRSAHKESLWTVPKDRHCPQTFRAFARSADKSLRDFLKGRHVVFLRGVYIEWKSRSRDSGGGAGTKLVLRSDNAGRRA